MTEFQHADFLHRAELFESAGNHLHAVQLYKRILLEHPDDIAVKSRLAQVYEAIGNYGSAENELLGALRYSESKEGILIALAKMFYKANLKEQASYYLEQLIPFKSPEARLLQGSLAYQSGNYVDARRHLLLAVEYDESLFPAHALLSEIFIHTADFALAAFHAGKAVLLHPNDAEQRLRYGRALLLANRFQESYLQIAPLLDDSPVASLAAVLASQCQSQLGNPGHARHILVEARDRDPRSIPVLLALGELCLSASDRSGARSHFEQALNIDPENAHALEMVQLLRPTESL